MSKFNDNHHVTNDVSSAFDDIESFIEEDIDGDNQCMPCNLPHLDDVNERPIWRRRDIQG